MASSVTGDIDGLLKTLAVIGLCVFGYNYAVSRGWIKGFPSAPPAPPVPPAPPAPPGPQTSGADALVPLRSDQDYSALQYFDPVYWFAKLGFPLAVQQWNNANAAPTTPAAPPAPVPDYLQSVDMTDFYAPQNWQGGN
jgi:hypothetical protein